MAPAFRRPHAGSGPGPAGSPGGGGRLLASVGLDGNLWTWGRLQDSSGTTLLPPQRAAPVPSLDNILTVTAGEGHTLALRGDKTLWAWAPATRGVSASGSVDQYESPVRVASLAGVAGVEAEASHRGGARGWLRLGLGLQRDGSLGTGTTASRWRRSCPRRSRASATWRPSPRAGNSPRPCVPTARRGPGATTPGASSGMGRGRTAPRPARCWGSRMSSRSPRAASASWP